MRVFQECNKEVADSALGMVFFNATISTVHPIKMTFRFRMALKEINWPESVPIPVVFIVPDEIYDEFKAQSVVIGAPPKVNGKIIEKYENVVLPDYKVKQFVMCLDASQNDAFFDLGKLTIEDLKVEISETSLGSKI